MAQVPLPVCIRLHLPPVPLLLVASEQVPMEGQCVGGSQIPPLLLSEPVEKQLTVPTTGPPQC